MKKVLSIILCLLMVCLSASALADGQKVGVSMPTKDLQRWNQDGDNMQKLLEEAGYKFENGVLSSETPISIEYLTNQSSGHIAVAESMQQDFAAVGIEMTIQVQDWNVFLEERKAGNFDFAREGWIADFNDPINMLEMWTTVSGNNDCQYGRYEGWDA